MRIHKAPGLIAAIEGAVSSPRGARHLPRKTLNCRHGHGQAHGFAGSRRRSGACSRAAASRAPRTSRRCNPRGRSGSSFPWPGAGADAIARAVAQMLTERWGQSAWSQPAALAACRDGAGRQGGADGYTLLSQGDTVMLLGVLKRVPFEFAGLRSYRCHVHTTHVLIAISAFPQVGQGAGCAFGRQTVSMRRRGSGQPVHLAWNGWRRYPRQIAVCPPTKAARLHRRGDRRRIHMAAVTRSPRAARSGPESASAGHAGLTRIPALPDLPTVAEQCFPGFKITIATTCLHRRDAARHYRGVNRVVSDGCTRRRWRSGWSPMAVNPPNA